MTTNFVKIGEIYSIPQYGGFYKIFEIILRANEEPYMVVQFLGCRKKDVAIFEDEKGLSEFSGLAPLTSSYLISSDDKPLITELFD